MSTRVKSAKPRNEAEPGCPPSFVIGGIETGDEMAFIDLGDAALVLPGGADGARSERTRVLSERYEAGLALVDHPELADQ